MFEFWGIWKKLLCARWIEREKTPFESIKGVQAAEIELQENYTKKTVLHKWRLIAIAICSSLGETN